MTEIISLGPLLRLARDTVIDPQTGALTVLKLQPSRQALWLMFAIIVVLSLILGQMADLLTSIGAAPDASGTQEEFDASPFTLAFLQAGFLYMMIHAVTHIGRMFGGTGQFHEAMLLMLWLQFIVFCVQVFQLAVFAVLPAVAGLVMLVAIALSFWLLVNFIAVLHGFTSLGMVFVMTIASAFSIFFVLSIVMLMLGIDPTGQMQ